MTISASSSTAAGGSPTPKFNPISRPSTFRSPISTNSEEWTEVLVANCHFGLSVFLAVVKELCLHPERNSSLILRADPIPVLESGNRSLPPSPRSHDKSESKPGESSTSALHNGTNQVEFEFIEEIRMRLMPKVPKRDGKMNQRCAFYRKEENSEEDTSEEGIVILWPEVKSKEDLPFYYPQVRGLMYRWEASDPSVEHEDVIDHADAVEVRSVEGQKDIAEGRENEIEEVLPIQGRISISYLPWPDESPTAPAAEEEKHPLPSFLALQRTSQPRKSSPLAVSAQKDSRKPSAAVDAPEQRPREKVDRICYALLERVYKHGFGNMVGYRKRVNHDVIVAREPFQDLYLILKDKHRHLDSRAPKPGYTKVEDVKRHVFKDPGLPDDPLLPLPHSHMSDSYSSNATIDLSEWGKQDVAVAAFLMLLWRDMYPARTLDESKEVNEWDSWGRPTGGFVDLGCGNGLLVHILTSEGYIGKGLELRSRRTWPLYPPETRRNLVELPINFPSWFPSTLLEWEEGIWEGKDGCMIKDDCFIIGNHADEVTPWIPLLSLIPSKPVPFLNLPCCAHTLDSTFNDSRFNAPPHDHTPKAGFEEGLEQGQSRYKAYIMWLGYVGLKCGWEWEKEGLRVPSTRSWGIVGRKRWAESYEQLKECREWALEQVNDVRARNMFKVRVKEGSSH